MNEARHFQVSGRVQGVYYRASLQAAADGLGLRGWCRNRADGRVEALAVGPVEALERLLAWSRQGPPQARVDDVTVRSVPVPDEYAEGRETRGFEIRR